MALSSTGLSHTCMHAVSSRYGAYSYPVVLCPPPVQPDYPGSYLIIREGSLAIKIQSRVIVV